MKLKLFALLVSLFLYQNTFAQYTDEINSNRPGTSMAAYSVGKTIFQLESGISYLNERHSISEYTAKGYGVDFVARYGFYREQMEGILNLNYQNDNYISTAFDNHRSGLKTVTLGLKYLVYDPYKNYEKKINFMSWKANHKYNWHQLIPAVSLYGGLNYNARPNLFTRYNNQIGLISPKLMLITQNILPGAWVFVANINIDQIGTAIESTGYVITLTKGFNDRWSGFLENKGIKSTYYSDGIFSVGAAYLFGQNIQFDASLSRNYKDTPTLIYGGIGASWRFDANYQDVLLRIPKADKKKDKSKKGKSKETEKKKKRLDEVQLEKP